MLSSMANIAGYRAVIEAGNNFAVFSLTDYSMERCLQQNFVIGAGVVGLAAIGTAQSLGDCEGFDVRPEVAEQIESGC